MADTKELISTTLLAGLIALTVPACSPAADAEASDPARALPGGLVTRGDFERELLLTGELEAVRSISIKSPQTTLFQMRIQFMAEEGSFVSEGDPLLDFDNSSLAAQVRDLETRILDAETQIVAKRNELATTLKDLEIEIAENQYEFDRAKLAASVDREVLSTKDHSERQLTLAKATEQLEETEERIELTANRGTAELDVLIINRDKLQKDMFSAEEALDLLSIKAPADGLVVYNPRPGTTLRFQEGDSCWPGMGIMRLPDLSEMRVAFHVNEVDEPQLDVGMSLRVGLDAFPGRELSAEIVRIPSMAVKRNENSDISVFKVLARLSETWVGEMKPGMSAMGRVVVQRMRDVPLVPRHAVGFDGEGYWLRAGAAGKRQAVAPVARNARFYVLSEEDFTRIAGRKPDGKTGEGAS